jgi:hypothetical protein
VGEEDQRQARIVRPLGRSRRRLGEVSRHCSSKNNIPGQASQALPGLPAFLARGRSVGAERQGKTALCRLRRWRLSESSTDQSVWANANEKVPASFYRSLQLEIAGALVALAVGVRVAAIFASVRLYVSEQSKKESPQCDGDRTAGFGRGGANGAMRLRLLTSLQTNPVTIRPGRARTPESQRPLPSPRFRRRAATGDPRKHIGGTAAGDSAQRLGRQAAAPRVL